MRLIIANEARRAEGLVGYLPSHIQLVVYFMSTANNQPKLEERVLNTLLRSFSDDHHYSE